MHYRKRVIVGPCSLGLTNKFASEETFNSKIRKDLRATGKLRNLFPKDGKCFIQDIVKNDNLGPISSPIKNSQNGNSINGKDIKEISVIKPDGTCINDEFYNILVNLEENDKKINWTK